MKTKPLSLTPFIHISEKRGTLTWYWGLHQLSSDTLEDDKKRKEAFDEIALLEAKQRVVEAIKTSPSSPQKEKAQ